ncbi:MAG: DUF72 domain-containing protein [Thermodesulfobacteriota bacterium]
MQAAGIRAKGWFAQTKRGQPVPGGKVRAETPDLFRGAGPHYGPDHGLGRVLYLYDYSRAELSAWAERLEPYLAGRTLYAFFNNDYGGHAIENARLFRRLLTGA